MRISYSAPAKVILSGEHAVVYGKPALVSAINLRLKFSLWEEKVKIVDKSILLISKTVKTYLKTQKIIYVDKEFNFKIESEIPVGRGLGSSAALSVAATTAFLEFYTGEQFKKETVNELAFQVEKYFHKNPSGVDNSAACFGEMILFQKQVGLSNIKYKIPKNIEEKLFLIDSGEPKETTGEMVDYVKTQNTTTIFNEIEKTTNKLMNSIKIDDENSFKNSIGENEKLLEEIGVVSDNTKKLMKDLSQFGVGKVTGAGGRKTGSGFILFYAEEENGLKSFLNNNKINYYHFIPDYQGLIKI
ncbi:MAG: mevalonate kinase [Patescibacteria group bacterium]